MVTKERAAAVRAAAARVGSRARAVRLAAAWAAVTLGVASAVVLETADRVVMKVRAGGVAARAAAA